MRRALSLSSCHRIISTPQYVVQTSPTECVAFSCFCWAQDEGFGGSTPTQPSGQHCNQDGATADPVQFYTRAVNGRAADVLKRADAGFYCVSSKAGHLCRCVSKELMDHDSIFSISHG